MEVARANAGAVRGRIRPDLRHLNRSCPEPEHSRRGKLAYRERVFFIQEFAEQLGFGVFVNAFPGDVFHDFHRA